MKNKETKLGFVIGILGGVIFLLFAISWIHFEVQLSKIPTLYSEYESYSENNTDKKNEYIKNKRDLNAQEGMWRAATEVLRISMVHIYLSIVSLVISAFGIYYIKKSLFATNKAIEQAKDSNQISVKSLEDSNRAWCQMIIENRNQYPDLGVAYAINTGKSPALNFSYGYFFQKGIPIDIQDNYLLDLVASHNNSFKPHGGVLHPNKPEVDSIRWKLTNLSEKFESEHKFFVCYIKYQTVYSDTFRYEAKIFQLEDGFIKGEYGNAVVN